MLALPFWVRCLVGLVFVLPILPLLALGIYWWWTYAGLYRWLVEAQVNLSGAYYPFACGIITLAVSILPGVILGRLLAELIIFLLGKAEVFPAVPESSPPISVDSSSVDRWFRKHGSLLFGLGFGLCMSIGGAVWTMAGSSAGSLQALDLEALETGKPPPTNFVQTKGSLLTDQMLVQREGSGQWYYVPFVSKRWQNGSPVAVYVAQPGTPRGQATSVTLKGMLSANGLPGPVRTAFEKSPVARPAQVHYLLYLGRDPQKTAQTGSTMVGIGFVVLGATGLLWFVKALRQGRNKSRTPRKKKRTDG